MKIINEGYPDGDEVLVERVSVTYYQESDCTESSELGQTITFETRDGGGGPFLHIKTEGWSMDDSYLEELLKDFKNRAGLV